MHYYNVKDVMKITGEGINKCYQIIRELNLQFKKDYPQSVSIQGKILKKYFDEKMGIKKDCSEEQ